VPSLGFATFCLVFWMRLHSAQIQDSHRPSVYASAHKNGFEVP
jgi:hypothetical protein